MKRVFVIGLYSLMVFSGSQGAFAAVIGQPTSFDVHITQGGTDIVNATNVLIPNDPNYLTGTQYIKIGNIGGGAGSLYLSVWMQDPTASESIMSFYIRATEPNNPLAASPLGLFNTSGQGDINVYISNLQFKVGALASDVSVAQFAAPLGDTFASLYMMDSNGWYYDLPGADPFWLGAKQTLQVPYSLFRDGDASHYQFMNGTGTNINIAWQNVYSPVDTAYTIMSSDFPYGTKTDTSHGTVFEMGLDVFAWANTSVPEPASLTLIIMGAVAAFRRRMR
jgi:hypothetical protein